MADNTCTEGVYSPLKLALDFNTGELNQPATSWERKLSEMRGFYQDQDQFNAMTVGEDPMVYKVYEYKLPEINGHLNPVTTVLYPGLVGDEFFMTKGHYHEKKHTAEIYWVLSGRGVLLMQTDDYTSEHIVFNNGDLLYIPPCWAHRMVNTSLEESLVFYGVYPADSGHDYGTIDKTGFVNKVIFDASAKNNFQIV